MKRSELLVAFNRTKALKEKNKHIKKKWYYCMSIFYDHLIEKNRDKYINLTIRIDGYFEGKKERNILEAFMNDPRKNLRKFELR